MKITTAKLKEVLSKVSTNLGNNKLIPITSMIGMKTVDGNLYIISTDMNNTVCGIIADVEGEINVTIEADKFIKLISKTNTSEVTINTDESSVIVKANGTHRLPIVTDENGTVEFPMFNSSKYDNSDEYEIKLSDILSIKNSNESALAKTLENPELTGYYAGEKTVSSDSVVICFNDTDLGFNNPMLLSAKMVQLLSLNKYEIIKYKEHKGRLLFYTNELIIEGAILEGVEDFPIEPINAYLGEEFESNCKISKSYLIEVLDRLSLFVEAYDKNGAFFTFKGSEILVHSKNGASVESVKYIESNNHCDFECFVDVPLLLEQLKSNPEDTIKLWYGNENAVKITNEKVTQIIALLEDVA